MARLLPYIGSLLYITLQWQISSGSTISENKTLQIGDKLTLASPRFPVCCTQDFKFLMKCSSVSCGFNILFLDVDLPSTASLIIQGDPSNAAPVLDRAWLEEGVWSRPSLIHKGRTMSITLSVPYQKVYSAYSGVKLQVHAFSTVDQRLIEADVTSAEQCGRTTLNVWKGGEVKLTPGTSSAMLDCIWLLKKPDQAEDANAFVRFTYTSDLHGILAVRNGTNSAAPPLFYFDTEDGSTPIMHGREGFTSPNDLFVRMRKPLDSGFLTYVYGLFARRDNAVKGDECSINGYAGYFCDESKWCIPMLDRCDQVKHCPKGEDETNCDGFQPVTYNLPTTTTVKMTTSPTPASRTTYAPATSTCKFGYRLCKDGSCVSTNRCQNGASTMSKLNLTGNGISLVTSGQAGVCEEHASNFSMGAAGECYSFEKKCPDNSCVSSHKKCPGECSLWEKKCRDGRCISIGNRCPGECHAQEKKCPNGKCINYDRYCPSASCPSSEPHRCSDQCYSDDEKCNDYSDCDDGSDERDCSKFPWYIILIILVVAAMILMILCAKKKSREADEVQARTGPQLTSLAGTRNTRGPVIAGAPNTPYPTHNATSNSSAEATNDAPTVTTPLAVHPSAPPSYTEAINTAYNPQPTAPMLDEPAPPPYEAIAATNLPNKNSTSPV